MIQHSIPSISGLMPLFDDVTVRALPRRELLALLSLTYHAAMGLRLRRHRQILGAPPGADIMLYLSPIERAVLRLAFQSAVEIARERSATTPTDYRIAALLGGRIGYHARLRLECDLARPVVS